MRMLPWIAALTLSGAALAAPIASKPMVVLSPNGLTFGSAKAKAGFGLPRAAALKIVAAALGKPLAQGTYPDCGQGDPMGYARYKGSLEIVFLKGKFSGWSIDDKANPAWHSPRGIAIGSTRAALKKAYPKVTIDDGSLGVMFTAEDDVSGFLDSMKPGAKVTSMYAGETCMVS